MTPLLFRFTAPVRLQHRRRRIKRASRRTGRSQPRAFHPSGYIYWISTVRLRVVSGSGFTAGCTLLSVIPFSHPDRKKERRGIIGLHYRNRTTIRLSVLCAKHSGSPLCTHRSLSVFSFFLEGVGDERASEHLRPRLVYKQSTRKADRPLGVGIDPLCASRHAFKIRS